MMRKSLTTMEPRGEGLARSYHHSAGAALRTDMPVFFSLNGVVMALSQSQSQS
jgi:hypothetical protein